MEDQLWQIEFQVDTKHAETYSEVLEDALATSWSMINETTCLFKAIFDEPPKTADLNLRFNSISDKYETTVPVFEIQQVPDLDWLATSYKNFPPLKIGNFYIYGSHVEDPVPGTRTPLQINAANAFGSGEHATTEGCLKAIEIFSKENTYTKPLDMGCGSGILAMALAKTLEVPVVAADNDPEAVRVTVENATLNQLAGLIKPVLSEGFNDPSIDEQGPYDMIVANILAGPLCSMAADVAVHLQPQGLAILSGLLNTQRGQVVEAYGQAGIKLVDVICIGDWSTLIMSKPV